MLIEVTEIHPPKIGGKVSRIVAADGEHYQIWPEKLAGVDVGKRYEVETTQREYNGRTFKSIKSIVPAAEESTPVQKNRGVENDPTVCGEAEYVGRVIAALIASGGIDKTQIATATRWLRNIWRNEHANSTN